MPDQPDCEQLRREGDETWLALQRGDCMPLRELFRHQVDAIEAVSVVHWQNSVLRQMLAADPFWQREMAEARAAIERGDTITLEELEAKYPSAPSTESETEHYPHSFRAAGGNHTLCDVCENTLGKPWHHMSTERRERDGG